MSSSPLWLFSWPPVQPSWAGDHNTCWSLLLSASPGSILANHSAQLPSQSPAVFKEAECVEYSQTNSSGAKEVDIDWGQLEGHQHQLGMVQRKWLSRSSQVMALRKADIPGEASGKVLKDCANKPGVLGTCCCPTLEDPRWRHLKDAYTQMLFINYSFIVSAIMANKLIRKTSHCSFLLFYCLVVLDKCMVDCDDKSGDEFIAGQRRNKQPFALTGTLE